MKLVKVKYTVKESFVNKNKHNIADVMKELKALNDERIKYTVFLNDDGKTFEHMVLLKSKDAQDVIPNLPAFKKFQKELKENAEIPPEAKQLKLVNASWI